MDDSVCHDEEDLDDGLSYGTEYQLESDKSTGVSDVSSVNSDTSVDDDTPIYQDLKPVIDKVLKEKK